MLRMLTAGESHGSCLVVIVDGLPAGLSINTSWIDRDLARRQRGYGRNRRMQIENDHVEILGGVINGMTIGAPVALRVENKDWINWRDHWEKNDLPQLSVPRPGHADYSGMIKYGFNDARMVLERASARETTMRVTAGSLAKHLLAEFDIAVGSYVTEIGSVVAMVPDLPMKDIWALAEASEINNPDKETDVLMKMAIDQARNDGDTLGGVFSVSATGVMIGLGSYVQWDRRMDMRIAAAIMSIPGVKGVEIGSAFENARLPGTKVHDGLYPDGMGGVKRLTNRAGGIEGGVTNGEVVIVHGAMKPISTTTKPIDSVDLGRNQDQQNKEILASKPSYQRSDFCAVPSASIIGEAMLAWTLADALLEKLGGDSLAEMKR